MSITNYYVKTSGSNLLDGLSWANAWATWGYTFQNAPASSIVYAEEGNYGNETLSNINPANPPLSVIIQDYNHASNPCRCIVTDKSFLTVGSTCVSRAAAWNLNATVIQTVNTIGNNGTLKYWCCYSGNGSGSAKIKVFRDDGTNYNFIGESDYIELDAGRNFGTCDITVQSGDLIAFKPTSAMALGIATGSTCYYKDGDITSNSAKSTWTSNVYGIMSFGGSGLY